MLREPTSDNVRSLIELWRQASAAIDRGDDRDACLKSLELGLRVVFPPVPDNDPRLWKRCQTCQDTGYEIVYRPDKLYPYPVRYARPCTCEQGKAHERTIMAYDAAQSERRRGGKSKSGWSRV